MLGPGSKIQLTRGQMIMSMEYPKNKNKVKQ